MFFTSGGNLQKVHYNGVLEIKLLSKVHTQNTLECYLFPIVLSDVLFANYTQRYCLFRNLN